MTVGVIAHIDNPSLDEVRQLACTAEQAGADWLGVADAFWWRDTWLLLAEAARATARIRLGPLVTNPYLRHPFVTVSALASLQDLAGPRVFAGLGAGGSENPPGGEDSDGLLSRAATYAVLNNRPALRESWGVAPANVDRIRELLVSGRAQDAAALVPQAVFDDLATEREVNGAAAIAARIGATGIAVAATDLGRVAHDVQWAAR